MQWFYLFPGDADRAAVTDVRRTDIPAVIRTVIETGGGPAAATATETGIATGTGAGPATRTGDPPETRTGETGTGTVRQRVRSINHTGT